MIIYTYIYISMCVGPDIQYRHPQESPKARNQVWQVVDTQNYLLPQRRNRVYGLAFLLAGDTEGEVWQEYAQALQSLRSNWQFPTSQIFEKLSPQIAKGRHKELIAMAQARSPCSNSLYVDCASSKERLTYGDSILPCITPTHPIFSTLLQRYLGKRDFLNCQGLWESCFSPEAYRHLLAMDSQDVAGNSFSSTACQAVVLSSLTCAAGAWGAILRAEPSSATAQEGPLVKAQGGDQIQVPAPQPGILRRLKRKQPAPEFDQFQSEKVRRDQKRKKGHLPGRGKGRYRRKVKGVDSRIQNTGKSKSITIWEKEQV